MSKKVFVDTEFSGLGQHWPWLISIALVAEDESIPSLYIETPPESWGGKATPWVMENVVPHLRGGEAIVPLCEIKVRLLEWIEKMGHIVVVTDCPEYDFAFLRAILDPWPKCVAKNALRFSTGSMGREHEAGLKAARDSFFGQGMPEHHALADAFALRRMWFAAAAFGGVT